MPGLSNLNKILQAVKDGDISMSYAKKAKRAIGKKPKQNRPKDFRKKTNKRNINKTKTRTY